MTTGNDNAGSASTLTETTGSLCLECQDSLEIPYKVMCLIRFGKFPTLCAGCFLERVKRWALEDEDEPDTEKRRE